MPLLSNGLKLGRLARSHDPKIPILHNLMAAAKLTPPPPPPSVDYTKGMPTDLGIMMNDTLGDCTCAAFYHALQVWSFNASAGKKMDTEPDKDVELLYEQACGYKPTTPGEGPGGNEQTVLKFILNKGAPSGPNGTQRQKIAAFVEVDVKNTDNVKRTINDCGVCYIGFNVPAFLMPANAPPPEVWDVKAGQDNKIIGGHAVVLAGYNAAGARVISWGNYYTMTWAFFAKFVDEAYAIADAAWFGAEKKTVGGLTLQQLEAAMNALES